MRKAAATLTPAATDTKYETIRLLSMQTIRIMKGTAHCRKRQKEVSGSIKHSRHQPKQLVCDINQSLFHLLMSYSAFLHFMKVHKFKRKLFELQMRFDQKQHKN